MLKVKHARTADCVVAGFRWHKDGQARGLAAPRPLRRCRRAPPRRRASAFTMAGEEAAGGGARAAPRGRSRDAPLARLGRGEQRRRRPAHAGRPSRWNTRQGPLLGAGAASERVVEVKYDHLEGDRFRHATHFLRWRPGQADRGGATSYAQLEAVARCRRAVADGVR